MTTAVRHLTTGANRGLFVKLLLKRIIYGWMPFMLSDHIALVKDFTWFIFLVTNNIRKKEIANLNKNVS